MNNKKIHISILTIFLAATLISSVTALGVNHVYAEDKRDHKDKDNHDDDKDKNYDKNKKHGKKITNNYATEGIGQSTETYSSSSCGSGNDTEASCNNVALSFNLNDGNNALGQQ